VSAGERAGEVALVVVVMACGVGLCLHHGRVGFMPLDQSIVWDGAWRLLCGQRPFRDFVTPNGLVPMAMQAVVFKVFGVTWFAYVLHAAVVNGLFGAAGYGLLRAFGAPPVLAAVYALLGGVVFYPPFGAPFMDQHAFFFVLLSVLATAAAFQLQGRAAQFAAFALPWLAVLAWLSKQMPSVLVPLAVAAVWLAGPARAWRPLLRAFGMGTLSAVMLLATAVLAMDASLVATYAFELPGAIGRARLGQLVSSPAEYVAACAEARRAWGMTSVEIVTLAFGFGFPLAARAARDRSALRRLAAGLFGAGAYFLAGPSTARAGVAAAMLAVALVPSPSLDDGGHRLRPVFAHVVLAEVLVLLCLAHAVLTFNQPHNAIPFAFVALGLVHLAALRTTTGAGAGTVRAIVTAALVVVAGHDAWSFESRVNATRRVHKLDRTQVPVAAATAGLPPAMAFMRWQTPAEVALRAEDLSEVTRVLAKAPRNFLLLGDTSILYALTGRPSVAPSVWFHPGLTYPAPGTIAFSGYEDALMSALSRRDVGYVVLEGSHTFLGTQLSDFPRLQGLVAREGCGRREIGSFSILTLCR
jgi:hypothetical protein